MCPPRIMLKDSTESKVEAPGIKVTSHISILASPHPTCLLARVDDIGIQLLFRGQWSHAENAILTLNPYPKVGGYIGRDKCWNTNAKVDVRAVL